MNKSDAISVVTAIDKVIGLPGCFCEMLEKKLIDGDCEYVINAIKTNCEDRGKRIAIEEGRAPESLITLNEYQERALETMMPTCDNWTYMFSNLVAEVGEVAGKVAKGVRKNQVHTINNDLVMAFSDEAQFIGEIKLELGDILWQLQGCCRVMGLSLEEVAKANLEKLADRKKRNTIDGNGDHR